MTYEKLVTALQYRLVADGDRQAVIEDAYAGDLLSDVMGNANQDSVLITIQAHKNTVAVASLVQIHLIVLSNDRKAPEDMRTAATEQNIAICETTDNQFVAAYKIARLLGKV